MIVRSIVFLLINFAALGLGSIFTGKGVPSAWYRELNKAPWTPPGWMFGAAWTLIMICFAVYMAWLWKAAGNTGKIAALFILQWVLNVLWNPVFFHFHMVAVGLVIITGLTVLTGYFFFNYLELGWGWSLLVLPYVVWLIIATSLNGFILLHN